VFYVGKGKDGRINFHEREAKSGVESPKCAKIREIWSAGLSVKKDKLAFFNDERAAYEEESRLIQSLPNLTNFGRRYTVDAFLRLLIIVLRAQKPSGVWSRALWKAAKARLPALMKKAIETYTYDGLAQKLAAHNIELRPIAIND
jgi:hypothetical protein